MTRTRRPRQHTGRKPRLTRRQYGNFMVAINGQIIGGWPKCNPEHLQNLIDDFPSQCADMGCPGPMDLDAASSIMEGFLTDPPTTRKHDMLDGALITWWLATSDPEWPRMMAQLGYGINFLADLRNDGGKPQVLVSSTPIH